jgi:cardiolipin synthase (CMP-forming)
MVAAALIVLVDLAAPMPSIAFIIIGREITISALREWMAQIGKGRSVAVSLVGKVKTGFRRWWRSRCCCTRSGRPVRHRVLGHLAHLIAAVADGDFDGLLPQALAAASREGPGPGSA